jgi:F420-non-reducing hydrogenase small subunit
MILSTLCLGSCSGCHISLLGLGEDLLSVLNHLEIVFSPLLMDQKNAQPCDLGIVEGAPRNEDDVKHLKELREKAKKIIAIGSCACYGGITGLANLTSAEGILAEAYQSAPGKTPKLQPRIYPLDHFITVDWYIPGCPPLPNVLAEALIALINGKEPPHHNLPVCAECKRKAEIKINEKFVRSIEKVPEPNECLLSQGYICLGSVTRGGCEATCTKAGLPCLGCRGPADRVLSEPGHGIYRDLTRRRAHLLRMSERDVEKGIYDLAHTLYLFTLSSPTMRAKRMEKVADVIHRITIKPGEVI